MNPWTVALQAPLSLGIFQARILGWVAILFSRGASQIRDRTHIYCTGRWILYHWFFTHLGNPKFLAFWECLFGNPARLCWTSFWLTGAGESLKMDLIWGQSSDGGGLLTPLIKDFMHHQYVLGNRWEGNRQEGQGSPNGGNRLQVPDILISLKQQEETNWRYFFLLYTNLKGGFS